VRLPAGYVTVDTPGAQAFALPEARAWVKRALEEAGTLHDWALSAPGSGAMEGRGPVPVVPAPDGRWAVRHYFRGGAMGPILGDRYLRVGEPRPISETRWAGEVKRRDVPTPEVVAGAVYPAGLFYRGDLVTAYVPDSRDLAAILFDEDDDVRWTGARARALSLAGHLVVRTAEARVYHPDLNARNILVAHREDGLAVLLLDLDRCRLDVAGPDLVAAAMIGRLERSLRKFERATGRSLGEDEWEVLREAVRTGGPLEGT
jgi:3-deoxy-D-manno-octulosonic acid kinase